MNPLSIHSQRGPFLVSLKQSHDAITVRIGTLIASHRVINFFRSDLRANNTGRISWESQINAINGALWKLDFPPAQRQLLEKSLRERLEEWVQCDLDVACSILRMTPKEPDGGGRG